MPTGKPDMRLSFQVIFHSIKVSIKDNHHRDPIRENLWQELRHSCQPYCIVSSQSQPSKDSEERVAREDTNIHVIDCCQETKEGLCLSSLPVGSKFVPSLTMDSVKGRSSHTTVQYR